MEYTIEIEYQNGFEDKRQVIDAIKDYSKTAKEFYQEYSSSATIEEWDNAREELAMFTKVHTGTLITLIEERENTSYKYYFLDGKVQQEEQQVIYKFNELDTDNMKSLPQVETQTEGFPKDYRTPKNEYVLTCRDGNELERGTEMECVETLRELEEPNLTITESLTRYGYSIAKISI